METYPVQDSCNQVIDCDTNSKGTKSLYKGKTKALKESSIDELEFEVGSFEQPHSPISWPKLSSISVWEKWVKFSNQLLKESFEKLNQLIIHYHVP